MRRVRVMAGPEAGRELEVDRELLIGREDGDLVIRDEQISGRHAVLRPVALGVEVEDLGSLNGTYVDGQRISEPVTITIRGEVSMGASTFTVDVSLPREAVRPPEQTPDPAASQRAVTVAPGRQAAPPPPVDGGPIAPAQPAAPSRAAAPPAPAAAQQAPSAGVTEEESRVESPHLPIAISMLIYVGALAVIGLLLFLAEQDVI